MSVTTTYPFDTPSNYTYPSTVNIAGGQAQLVLEDNPNQDFNQDFSSDVGFIYNASFTEFVAGVMKQIDQTPANSTFGATYTDDINGSFGDGVLTGTAVGGASISDNKLDLANNDVRYVTYDGDLNSDSQQTGCIRFIVTPNYTGTPTTLQNYIQIAKANGDNFNMIYIRHAHTTGNLDVGIYSQSGGPLVSFTAIIGWNPISGTSYEIELNFDLTVGATRLFINGTQEGATNTATGVRSADIGMLRIGSNLSGTVSSNFSIEDFIYFSTVQHTTNYTSGYTLPEYKYIEDTITLPEMEYTGPGTLISFDSFTTTELNVPKYSLQIGRSGDFLYFDGMVWTVSDGTYGQASTKSVFNANLSSLPILGEIYGQFRVHFPNSRIESSIAELGDELTASLTAQAYPTTNPTVEINSSVNIEELLTFVETSVKAGSDEIKYILKKGSTWYYYSSGWVASDETYAQSNTAAEITTNISTFVTSKETIKIKLFLHSDDGSTTPSIQTLTISYDFAGESQDTLNLCAVYFYSRNSDGSVNTGDVTATLSNYGVKYKDNVSIDDYVITVTPDATNGYTELNLIENVNMTLVSGKDVTYKIVQNDQTIATISVPDQTGAILWDILA